MPRKTSRPLIVFGLVGLSAVAVTVPFLRPPAAPPGSDEHDGWPSSIGVPVLQRVPETGPRDVGPDETALVVRAGRHDIGYLTSDGRYQVHPPWEPISDRCPSPTGVPVQVDDSVAQRVWQQWRASRFTEGSGDPPWPRRPLPL